MAPAVAGTKSMDRADGGGSPGSNRRDVNRETPEDYFRGRAAALREEGYPNAAAMMDRLADNCAAMAAEFAALPVDDYIPF
jgi:hypothetical protein